MPAQAKVHELQCIIIRTKHFYGIQFMKLSRHLSLNHTCYKLCLNIANSKISCKNELGLYLYPTLFFARLCVVHFVRKPDVYCLIVGHLERVEFSPLFSFFVHRKQLISINRPLSSASNYPHCHFCI